MSGIYARLYLLRPDLFPWAGMAAFASFRVGLLLSIYDFAYDRDYAEMAEQVENLFDEAQLISSFETLRRTNNDVFKSAGLAHLGYVASGYDTDFVAELLELPAHRDLVEAFRTVDAGRKLLISGESADGVAHVWRGNAAILEHEQSVTVQGHFEQSTFQLGLIMTLATSLDFDGNHLRRDAATYCSFRRFMWTRGLWRLIATASWPDIRRVAHRWPWIRDSVLPTWRRVIEHDTDLVRKLRRIAHKSTALDCDQLLHSLLPPETRAR